MQEQSLPADEPFLSAEDELISLFDISKFPWTESIRQDIETRRAHMADLNIFDLLLISGGVKQPDALYPPENEEGLRRLLQEIAHSGYDTLKRDCLVYFLLKWHQDGREDDFQEERCIPPQFAALSNAYWHLDTGIDLLKAVTLLSDLRLNRDFSSKVMSALSISGSDAYTLILKYVRTAKPQLTEPDDLELYTTALAESSLREAWQFTRTFAEHGETRGHLFSTILLWCLTPPKPLALQQLIAFPLSSYEQSLLHDAALQPPSSIPETSIPIIQDLVCVRLIQSGKYTEAIKLDRQFAPPNGHAQAAHRKATQDRRQMMDEILAAMPAVECDVLGAELDSIARGDQASKVASGSGTGFVKSKAKPAAKDLGMTWETASLMSTSMYVSTRVAPPPPSMVNGASMANGGARFNPNARASNGFTSSSGPGAAPSPTPSGSAHLRSFGAETLSSHGQNSRAAPGPSPLFNAVPVSIPDPTFNGAFKSASSVSSAFYTPSTSNGVKRNAVGMLAESISAVHQQESEDVNMESDFDDVVVPRRSNGGTPRPNNGHSRDEATPRANKTPKTSGQTPEDELSFSLFNSGESREEKSEKTRTPVQRSETQLKMPPGAFVSSDEEHEAPAPAATSTISRRVSARISKPKEPAALSISTRSTRSSRVKDKNLGRSLPGSLMDEETEEEDEDEVAPLPKSPAKKVTARRGRTSNIEPGTPVRRSTRLSTAPSSRADSSSPEVSPQRPARKAARKSVAASEAPPAAKGGRRKRV